MADDQANPLKAAGIELTEEVINKNRWYAFWDSPLVMPGSQEMQDEAAWRRSQQAAGGRGGRGQAQNADSLIPNRTLGTPRTPSEIRRADSSFHDDIVQREDRRREPRRDVPRVVDGDLRRRPAVHRLQRHQPGADGRGGQDQRTVGGLQVRRRAEGVLDRPDAARHLARHRRPPAASSVRRRGQHDAGAREGAEPADRGRSQRRRACGVPSTAHLLLHPREGHQPRLRVVPEGRRRKVRHRRRLPRA